MLNITIRGKIISVNGNKWIFTEKIKIIGNTENNIGCIIKENFSLFFNLFIIKISFVYYSVF